MRNLLGVLSGIFITSIGAIILKGPEIATGGTAGLALAGSYIFDISFSLIFFLINIPFYIFSYFQTGIKFTLTTIFSVSVLSLFTSIISKFAVFSYSFPAFIGVVIGGGLVGFGLSLLFNNNSSLGGLNIIGLYFSKNTILIQKKPLFSLML